MYAITPKERLRQYAKHKFGEYKALEIKCGLTNGTLANNSEPNVRVLQKVLEACPELSPDWLILGLGTMERGIPTAKPQPIGVNVTDDGLDIGTSHVQSALLKEPTQPYNSNKRDKDEMVTIPSSILDALRQQLENKDAQIATLLQVINNTK